MGRVVSSRGESLVREIAQWKLPIGAEGVALSFLERWATLIFFAILVVLLLFARQGLVPLLLGWMKQLRIRGG
jgi:hypothetical protein